MLTFIINTKNGDKKIKIIITLCFVLGVGIVAILIYTYGIKLRVKELTKGKREKGKNNKTH
jgi:hypothetical protein